MKSYNIYVHVNLEGIQVKSSKYSKVFYSYYKDRTFPKGVFRLNILTNESQDVNIDASHYYADGQLSTYERLKRKLNEELQKEECKRHYDKVLRS